MTPCGGASWLWPLGVARSNVLAVAGWLRLGLDRVRRMAEQKARRLLQMGRLAPGPALYPDVALALADEIRGAAIGAGSPSCARRAGDDRLPAARPDSDLARQPRRATSSVGSAATKS